MDVRGENFVILTLVLCLKLHILNIRPTNFSGYHVSVHSVNGPYHVLHYIVANLHHAVAYLAGMTDVWSTE